MPTGGTTTTSLGTSTVVLPGTIRNKCRVWCLAKRNVQSPGACSSQLLPCLVAWYFRGGGGGQASANALWWCTCSINSSIQTVVYYYSSVHIVVLWSDAFAFDTEGCLDLVGSPV